MSKEFFEKLSENNPYLENYRTFEKELENNSDRGTVLICTSILDAQLEKLLKSFLISNKKIDEELFKPTQALGNSSAKINMSYYLGLITKTEKNNLNSIRKIRNIFAHQINQLSFDDPRILGLCNNLIIPKNSYFPSNIPSPKKNSTSLPKVDLNPIKKDTEAKDRFIYTFQYLYTLLNFKTNIQPKKKLEEETKIYTVSEQIDTMKKKLSELLNEIEQNKQKYKELKEKHAQLSKEDTSEEKTEMENKDDYDSINYEGYRHLISMAEYSHTVLKNSEID